MDLERIHPYLDFNCRTFAVFLLNKELIRHDLEPSLMEDPNDFDFMTNEELIDKIEEGQANYRKLSTNGKIKEKDPGDELLIANTLSNSGLIYVFCQKKVQNKIIKKKINKEMFNKLFIMVKKQPNLNIQQIKELAITLIKQEP